MEPRFKQVRLLKYRIEYHYFFHNTLRCLLHCGHNFYIIPSSLKRTIIETKESVFDSNWDSKILEIAVRYLNKPYLRHVHTDLDFHWVTFQEKHWVLLIAVTGRLTMCCPTCFFHIGITVLSYVPYLLEYKSHSCISRTPTLELKIGTKLF